MLYQLMHKDIVVALFDMSAKGHIEKSSIEVFTPSHLPVGAKTKHDFAERWWVERAIPESRDYIKQLVKYNKEMNNVVLNMQNYGLSLTDCYWIRPYREENLKWEHVSLYQNAYLDEHSLIRMKEQVVPKLDRKLAPASSQGELEKFWTRDSAGNNWMVKGNYSPKIQQSLNEIYTSQLLERLEIFPFVKYQMVEITSDYAESVGCMCKSYTSEQTESFSLWDLLVENKKTTSSNLYQDSLNILENIGLSPRETKEFIDKEIIIDYALSNIDRHMRNIEVLRNPDTLEIIGLAPAFDFGNSMFFRVEKSEKLPNDAKLSKLETHSFVNSENRLLRHADRTIRVNYDILRDKKLFDEVYGQDTTKSSEFYAGLYQVYLKKIDMLYSYLK